MTPYQIQVIADGALSYVPGDELSGPIHDIVQSLTNSATGPAPTLGNPSLPGLSTSMGMTRAASPTTQVQIASPIPSSQVPAVTVECWFSSTDTVPVAAGMLSKAVALFSDITTFGQNDWGLGFSGAMIPQWAKGHPPTGNDDVLAGPSLNDGNWHHVVATWDGVAGTAQMYIDGSLYASVASWYQGTTGGNGQWWSGDNGGGFTGLINNLALYGTVLSPTKIANHYNLGLGAVSVPDVTNIDLATAEATLVAAGLIVGPVMMVCSDTIAPGNVVSTSPAAGASVVVGTTVTIFEANGACPPLFQLEAKFVAPLIGKAIMVANPGAINPRIYPPEVDTTIRVSPGTVI